MLKKSNHLNKLNGGVEVRLIKLIGYIPAERPKLAPLLDTRVQKSGRVKQWLPLGTVGHLEEIGAQPLEAPFQAGLYALRGLCRELDGDLEQTDRELGVRLGRDPDAEVLVGSLGGDERVKDLEMFTNKRFFMFLFF